MTVKSTIAFNSLVSNLQNCLIFYKTHINLHIRISFFNCLVRTHQAHAYQNLSLTANQRNRLNITYKTFLRHIVRNGLKQVDRESNDFRLVISNDQLHTICRTNDINKFLKHQQSSYANERSQKQLMIIKDAYTKHGRSTKTILEKLLDYY